MVELATLIQHPEQMDKETLYDLRSLLALHPYYQTVRLLVLQNLYVLHDPTFDEELRRSAIYITDRKVLFNLIEAAHYQLKSETINEQPTDEVDPDRTISLINSFLDTLPDDSTDDSQKCKPTPADAAVDYVSYLLESESENEQILVKQLPHLKGQELIDNFIEKSVDGRIQLNEKPEYIPELGENNKPTGTEEEFFTETLAKIYIKQGRYEQALEIIRRLNLNYPKKNAYFADQIRFLEKLILNNKTNK